MKQYDRLPGRGNGTFMSTIWHDVSSHLRFDARVSRLRDKMIAYDYDSDFIWEMYFIPRGILFGMLLQPGVRPIQPQTSNLVADQPIPLTPKQEL